MTFTYYYKTSDGARHEAEITSPSRDEAFAALRKQGIRPIKVVAKDGSPEGHGVRKRVVFAVAILVAAVTGGGVWWWSSRTVVSTGTLYGNVSKNAEAGTVQVRMSTATPLARQRIPGNRERVEKIPSDLFQHPAEMFLARFAEPGHEVADYVMTPEVEADFPAALKESIQIAADEFTEYVDLKRIVVGMKREMRAYLAGGGTAQEYVAELVKRQKMEISYREKAEKRLSELLTPASTSQTPQASHLATAYAYWLKANASLQSMGIAPLPLPDALRTYQMSLDIDDAEGVPTIESKVIESAPVSVPGK